MVCTIEMNSSVSEYNKEVVGHITCEFTSDRAIVSMTMTTIDVVD